VRPTRTDGTSAPLLVLGSVNIDIGLRVDHRPRGGETVLSTRMSLTSGGKGANQAVAAALAGAPVWLAGATGDDAYAATVRGALAEAGVRTDLLLTAAGEPTGVAVVQVTPDGENAITVAPGANHAVTVDQVSGLAARIAEAALLLVQLELPVPAVARAVELAAEAGSFVVANLAPAVPVPDDFLDRVDVLVVNRSEGESLLGRRIAEDALPQAAEDLLRIGPRAVVLTAGARGAVVADAEQVLALPAERVDVVDTAGAGDAFVGVLCAELLRGASLQQAAAAAMTAGTMAVQQEGAQVRLGDLFPTTDGARSSDPEGSTDASRHGSDDDDKKELVP
jgi:ribokinase